MGMDDLLALYVILRDPALDVRAIAIDGTGLVHCGAGIRNLRRILAAFDRLDIPFGCGREEPGRTAGPSRTSGAPRAMPCTAWCSRRSPPRSSHRTP